MVEYLEICRFGNLEIWMVEYLETYRFGWSNIWKLRALNDRIFEELGEHNIEYCEI